jgi:hypothetical protein
MTRLATFMAGYALYSIEISKGYGKVEWREDLKKVLLKAGVDEKPTVFLFNDTQIVFEGQVEDLNGVLNSGDVPNLYVPEDIDAITNACRGDCLKKRLPPTKINVFAQYLIRVKRNLHMAVAMSPMGDAFRNRLRMFPALVNCTTIDWFLEWPGDALKEVATKFLDDVRLAPPKLQVFGGEEEAKKAGGGGADLGDGGVGLQADVVEGQGDDGAERRHHRDHHALEVHAVAHVGAALRDVGRREQQRVGRFVERVEFMELAPLFKEWGRPVEHVADELHQPSRSIVSRRWRSMAP